MLGHTSERKQRSVWFASETACGPHVRTAHVRSAAVLLVGSIVIAAASCASPRNNADDHSAPASGQPHYEAPGAAGEGPGATHIRPNDERSREDQQKQQPNRDSLGEIEEERILEMVRAFVYHVHDLIDRGRYTRWKALLTDDYIRHFSDEDVLDSLSDSPTLRRKSIVLESLRDYFEHVVRASRRNVEVTAVEVIDDHSALAFSTVQAERAVLFKLVRRGEDWKIDKY